jgi:methyltransferase (TIGR00027 family)
MEMRKPSRTAINSAIWRAMHPLLDDEPKILVDPYARAFAGFSNDEELINANDKHPLAHIRWMRTQFPLRNRYTEEELVAAMEAGVTQYVILGAGLDSFAYRRGDLMQRLDVYEIDHPGSQAWKRARVAELSLEVPERLHYLPVDFEHETLADGLRRSSLRLDEQAFFSMLGVTQYLTQEAVERTLGDLAGAACRGSKLVIEFIAPPKSLAPDEATLVNAIAAGAGKVGEPWLSYFDGADMENILRQQGFSAVKHLGPEEATQRYLQGRTDGSRLPGYFRMALAIL